MTVVKSGARSEPQAPGRELDLERFLPYRLRVLSQTISGCLASIYATQFGLATPDWRTMVILARYQPLSANDVAGRSSMDKVQVSRAVARLTRTGLVVREVDSGDRRRSQLRLSTRGQSVYARLVPQVQLVEARLLDALDDSEREQLDRIVEKLQARAEALCERRD